MIRCIEVLICDGCGLRKEAGPDFGKGDAQHEADACRWLTLVAEKPRQHYCPSCKVPVILAANPGAKGS